MARRLVELWPKMPAPLLEQAATLLPYYRDRNRIKEFAAILHDKYHVKNQEDCLKLAIIKLAPLQEIIEPAYFKELYAYDGRGNRIEFKSVLTKGERVCLFRGIMTLSNGVKKDVVVKSYESDRRDIRLELDIYRLLRRAKCAQPWVSTGFFYFNVHILVMEPLEEVDAKTDKWQMVIDVLPQLYVIHSQWITHNDLKPGNIMYCDGKWRAPDAEICTVVSEATKPNFLIIDYGGVSNSVMKRTDKKTGKQVAYALRRRVWSPRFTTQKKGEHNQPTNGWWDLWELCVVIRCVELMAAKKSTRDCHHGYVGGLERMSRHLEKYKDYDHQAILDSKLYQELMDIAKDEQKKAKKASR